MSIILKVRVGDRWYTVEIGDLDSDPIETLVDGEPVQVKGDWPIRLDAPAVSPAAPQGRELPSPTTTPSPAGGADRPAPTPLPATPEVPAAGSPSAEKVFRAPMPGAILSVKVKVGDAVITGDEICVLEAMKMQQTLRAEWSGLVKTVFVRPGQQVAGGGPIIELE